MPCLTVSYLYVVDLTVKMYSRFAEKPMLMSAKETGNYADDFVEETDSDYSDDFDEDTFEAELVSGENKTENLGDYLDDFEEIDEEEEQVQ